MTWPEVVRFSQPLREINARPLGLATPHLPALLQEREQQGFDRGVAEGEKHLSEQLLRQRAEFVQLQNGVLAALRQAVGQVIQQSQDGLIDLAFEIAGKLVGGLPISRELIEAAVRTALEDVEKTALIAIRLHPADLALLQAQDSPLLSQATTNGGLQFQPSSEVTRGGCLVETRFGVVDARRETRLERLQKALVA